MSQATLYEIRDAAAWITLNQPERRNALSDEVVCGLRDGVERALADRAVRAVVITGSGQAFCAGADLKAGGVAAEEGAEQPFARLLDLIWNAPKPVIGRINGHAFGGGIGLVAACDLTVAADTARFSFSEVRVGVVPAMISVVVLPKIGIHNAMWLFLTAERFSAQQARDYGLIHRVVAAGDLDAAVADIIGLVRLGGPNAISEAKRLIRTVPALSMAEAFRHTSALIGRLFASDEAREGMQAFLQKRRPGWAPNDAG